ncbi:MAG: prepilin-type N-terminal cleavage/methylation domain-containing protein [Phycisphaerae bacterium]
MISRTGARRSSSRRPLPFASQTGKALHPAAAPFRAGFTLLEICLALALLGMLAVLGTISVASWQSSRFQRGVDQAETLLSMLRADAANQARRLQLQFDDAGRMSVAIEADPLANPGVFAPHSSALWLRYLPNEALHVTHVRLIGSGEYRAMLAGTHEAFGEEQALPAVQFEPDGTSDRVWIELAPTDEEDPRRVVIDWDGFTGRARVLETHQENLEELYAELEAELEAELTPDTPHE